MQGIYKYIPGKKNMFIVLQLFCIYIFCYM